MADGVTVDTYTVATDDAGAAGHVQLFKLAYDANGSATLVTADASGLKVQLGASLPSGSATIGDVTVSSLPALPAGTNAIGKLAANSGVDIGDVDVTSLPALVAGSATIGNVGLISSGTQVSVASTAGTLPGALAVAITDGDGDQVSMEPPVRIAVTPSVDTGAYAIGDNLDGTILSFANAAATPAGSGWITKVVLLDKDNEQADLDIFFLNASITPPSENSTFSLSDDDAEKIEAVVSTASTGSWTAYGGGAVKVCAIAPPVPFKLASGTTLYGVAKVIGAPTYTGASDLIITAHILPD